jgi:hypothetical protein
MKSTNKISTTAPTISDQEKKALDLLAKIFAGTVIKNGKDSKNI